MKKLLTILLTIYSLSIYSQAHIGVMGGVNIENDKSQLGVGLNYMLSPKISIGSMVMITPFNLDDDYMIMYNAKYSLQKFSLSAGLMTGEMEMDNMGMDMNSMGGVKKMDPEPYYGIEYKPFKNKMIKVYYRHSKMMKSIGIMVPILNIGKKMQMK